jgi:integrase
LPVFALPVGTPKAVAEQLEASFRLAWLDPGAAANRMRVALERLLDHFRIKKTGGRTNKGKVIGLTLHARILLYAVKQPVLGAQLLALKWLGNTASHEGQVSMSELLDADEILEHTLAGAQRGAVAERHLKQATRHLFNWAIEEGHATHTPFRSPQGVSLIHIKVTRGRKRRLQDGEEARILAAADQFIADFFTTMLETGCRPGELRTLQWSELRADHFVILAAKAKDREDRLIPVEPTLRAILDRRRAGPDGSDLPDDAYVFGNETGEVFSKERLCAMWRRVCEAAKVRDLHLHDLRAEFASQLSESKVSVEQVRDALGHSNISMTNTYLRSHKKSLSQAYKQRTTHRARQSMKRVV